MKAIQAIFFPVRLLIVVAWTIMVIFVAGIGAIEKYQLDEALQDNYYYLFFWKERAKF